MRNAIDYSKTAPLFNELSPNILNTHMGQEIAKKLAKTTCIGVTAPVLTSFTVPRQSPAAGRFHAELFVGGIFYLRKQMDTIQEIIKEYQGLHVHDVIDYDKFNQFSIVHHSSGIEGSTLTENETRLLLEEGITPKGKPLQHSLMVKDHYDALIFVLEAAQKKAPVTVGLIQAMNAKVMRHTGGLYNTLFGEVDASRGMFRKGNVSAGGSYFVNFDKVERYTIALAEKLADAMHAAESIEDQLTLSFSAHFDLVSIHPFYDGNGRTSRLLMNYLQTWYGLPLEIVYQEDKVDYFDSLQLARKEEDLSVFIAFMFSQYKKFLLTEMQQFRKDLSADLPNKKTPGKGKGLSLFF